MPDNFHDRSSRTDHFTAAQCHIPTIYPYRFFVEDGGLISYGVDVVELFRRAAEYVSRILHGAKPQICRFRHRRSLSWSSILRQLRRSV